MPPLCLGGEGGGQTSSALFPEPPDFPGEALLGLVLQARRGVRGSEIFPWLHLETELRGSMPRQEFVATGDFREREGGRKEGGRRRAVPTAL